MATYAIGDVQGCYKSLTKLLARCEFDEQHDRLWFVGDLVNRGPDSLSTLRFVHELGDRAVCVLGNHDLHLIAVAAGHARLRKDDTVDQVLTAPDGDALIEWLRCRPLLHREGELAMVHAGLLPQWSLDTAHAVAREVEAILRSPQYDSLLANMYGNDPDHWTPSLTGFARWRVIINAMTRMRVCTRDGRMELRFSGEPRDAPANTFAWFDVRDRVRGDEQIICGHWSAQGLLVRDDVVCLDTGCLWGRQLSALRLDDRQLFQVSCAEDAIAGREQ
jgi:bis(5'-nucleosyl)-tetraphosphatase (symmetrical)